MSAAPATPRPVTLVPADGVGPEVTEATVRILEAAAVPIRWERVETGRDALARSGTPLPAEAIASIRRNRLALKARITAPIGAAFENPNVTLRKVLDLYANVRPVRSFPGHPSRHPDLDLVIVRENTEGEYAGLEHQVVPGVVESIKVTSARACTRIARFAFALAAREQRRKVTAVHKANIMKRADGLFLECCRAVAAEYPAIEYQELIVDNTCMQLVMNPYQFDVLMTQNFYGDLISDLCAGLVGGLGVVPGVNVGDEIAVYEAIHGDAPELAGKNRANPMTLLVSALFMLRQIGLAAYAERITAATTAVLERKTHTTQDLGGTATTSGMADAIITALR
ncbi:MAG: NAD-dependent isocitrate dehydrogenase [Deltaproteobacteria bacterium]|nr:NAD-dependent isocitrate dehydrogenase [Deltaproteobacteria bacterium]